VAVEAPQLKVVEGLATFKIDKDVDPAHLNIFKTNHSPKLLHGVSSHVCPRYNGNNLPSSSM